MGVKDKFYELSELKDFDAIIGIKLLRKVKGNINIRDSTLEYDQGMIHLIFNESAIKAFKILKDKLCEQMTLNQPAFTLRFELTTDASNSAIGAVLSQNNKPVIFISRTLSKTEENYLYGVSGMVSAYIQITDRIRNCLQCRE